MLLILRSSATSAGSRSFSVGIFAAGAATFWALFRSPYWIPRGAPSPADCRSERAALKQGHARPRCACSVPPFAEAGRIHFIDFHIEKLVIARPRMDIAPTNLTAETARMLVFVMLPCGGVR